MIAATVIIPSMKRSPRDAEHTTRRSRTTLATTTIPASSSVTTTSGLIANAAAMSPDAIARTARVPPQVGHGSPLSVRNRQAPVDASPGPTHARAATMAPHASAAIPHTTGNRGHRFAGETGSSRGLMA